MDRSRSKRYYYDQDYESEALHSRSKPRYGSNSYGGGGGGGGGYHYAPSYHRRSASSLSLGGGGVGGRKMQESTLTVMTSYRILCYDVNAGGVIGKSGSIIRAIRQHTGAWINVHELIPGDEERIIEISDTRRRDPDGRMPSFSPAQEALFLIHDRILESEMGGYGNNVGFGDDENNGSRVVTRLVVSRVHVGCLLGKGGKIIEQMRMETKTHIRVLPRDHTLPRCISMSEEIVQVVGDLNAVKSAIAIISSRLRESQHRDRSNFGNRLPSPDGFYPADDDFHINSKIRRPSVEGPSFGSRYADGSRSSDYSSRSSGPTAIADNAHTSSGEEIVFRMLCPVDKIDSVVGEPDGIVDLLQNEIGVNIDVTDPLDGSNEHVIIISSDEVLELIRLVCLLGCPDDMLFPAQEALLHIQTRIVDLVPDRENIITSRLLLQSDEIGSLLELDKIGCANVKILSRGELPAGLSGADEIVQIVGEIKAAREALVEVTSRVRSYIYREILEKDGAVEPEAASRTNVPPSSENGPVVSTSQSFSASAAPQKPKEVGSHNVETVKQKESERREDQPSGLPRISVPLVTRSTLEVVIPPHAANELAKKSRKLALINELSGASVKLIDDRAEVTEKIIQISGTPEQAERAQSLLQGFILSTEEDGP